MVVGYDDIAAKNYSLSAGQYFDVRIECDGITPSEFKEKLDLFESNLNHLFSESAKIEEDILKSFGRLRYE